MLSSSALLICTPVITKALRKPSWGFSYIVILIYRITSQSAQGTEPDSVAIPSSNTLQSPAWCCNGRPAHRFDPESGIFSVFAVLIYILPSTFCPTLLQENAVLTWWAQLSLNTWCKEIWTPWGPVPWHFHTQWMTRLLLHSSEPFQTFPPGQEWTQCLPQEEFFKQHCHKIYILYLRNSTVKFQTLANGTQKK